MTWTKEELANFNESSTLQNHPFDSNKHWTEDNPVWCVVADNRLFIRGAKGDKATKWVLNGTANGGEVAVEGKLYQVNYNLVTDKETIKLVTEAYEKKYHGQYPIDLMVSEIAESGTVELIKDINKME